MSRNRILMIIDPETVEVFSDIDDQDMFAVNMAGAIESICHDQKWDLDEFMEIVNTVLTNKMEE